MLCLFVWRLIGENQAKRCKSAEKRDKRAFTWLLAFPVITGSWWIVSCRLDTLHKTCLNPSYCSSAGLPFLYRPKSLSRFAMAFHKTHTHWQHHELPLPVLWFGCSSSCTLLLKVQHLLLPCARLCFRLYCSFLEALLHQRVCWVSDGSQSIKPLLKCITEGSLHSLSFRATVRHR